MIKRFILAIAVIFPMSIFAQKFGVVDLESVFQAMPETETMKAQLTESSKKYEAEFQKLREELDRLYAQFQTISQYKGTPESIKELRMQEIQERQQNVEKFGSVCIVAAVFDRHRPLQISSTGFHRRYALGKSRKTKKADLTGQMCPDGRLLTVILPVVYTPLPSVI